MRILVIDDDPSILRMIDQVLQSLGHESVLVADPAELDQIDKSIDASIIDWHLGEDTCEKCVELIKGSYPGTPFMIITGDTDLDLIQSALDLGAMGWWFKTTGPENFRRQVQDLTQQAESRKAA